MVAPQHRYDHGPAQPWVSLFASAPLAAYQALPSAFRLEFGPVFYRGRLNGSARVLVVGQDPSTDELLAQRILVGTAGQRTQRLLAKLGLSQSYVMFNTFLYGIFGQFNDAKAALHANPAAEAAVQAFRNQVFDLVRSSNALSAILAFGAGAHQSLDAWPGAAGVPRFDLTHPTAPNDAQVLANWNGQLAAMGAAITADAGVTPDLTPCLPVTDPGAFADIPRADLPFEFMLNALRLKDGFALSQYAERTGLPMTAIAKGLDEAERKGLITRSLSHVTPTTRGFDFLNDLQALFLADTV